MIKKIGTQMQCLSVGWEKFRVCKGGGGCRNVDPTCMTRMMEDVIPDDLSKTSGVTSLTLITYTEGMAKEFTKLE